jgi:hypothetical protein
MATERLACPLCGWWRTLKWVKNPDTGERKEVRFDKVDPAAAQIWRLENLRGMGHGSHDAVLELLDARGLTGIDNDIQKQIIRQCHKILDVLEGKAPSTFVPMEPKQPTPPPPKKRKAGKEKPAEKTGKEKPAAKKKEVKPQPDSFGVYDTYDLREDADSERTRQMKIAPEFTWEIQPVKGTKGNTQFKLWWYAKIKGQGSKPAVEKPAPAKSPAAKVVVTPKPEVTDAYTPEQIAEAEDILSQMQTVLNGEKKADTVKKLERLMDKADHDMFDGMDFIENAIDEYKNVERSGSTPEEYAEEKQTAFDGIQEQIDDLALSDDVKAIQKRLKKKPK